MISRRTILRGVGVSVALPWMESLPAWGSPSDALHHGISTLQQHVELVPGLKGWENAAATGGLTAALRGRGYGTREIALLWSGNFLRVMRAAEAVAGG